MEQPIQVCLLNPQTICCKTNCVTGVGYASVSSNDFSLDDIDVISAWGPKMFNDPKVPSVVSYTPGNEQQWGKDLSSDAIALIHTKLQLDIDSVSGELDFILQALDGMKNLNYNEMIADGGLPSYTEKSPEQIVQYYLTKFFHGGLDNLRANNVEEFSQRTLNDTPTDIVITHPTVRGNSTLSCNFELTTVLELVIQSKELNVSCHNKSWIQPQIFPKIK